MGRVGRGTPRALLLWALGIAGTMLLLLALQLGPLRIGMSGTPILGFPIHHDDFRNLSYTQLGQRPSLRVRPVSSLALTLLSVSGTRVYYASLHLLLVAYVALVLAAVRRLFPATGWPALLAAGAAALAALLFESVPEYWLYSGLVTNLVSAVCGVAALLALEAEPRSRAARIAATAAGVALFTASIFAKEDFALAVTVAVALLAIERRLYGDRHRQRRDLVALAALVSVSAAFLAWSFDGRPTFFRASGETYRSDFSPGSLLPTAFWYLSCTPGACIATGAQLGLLALLAAAGRWRQAARAAGIAAITLALLVPYAALPRHRYWFYAFNWTVWQAAGLLALAPLIAGARRAGRVLLSCGLVVTLGVWVATTQPRRAGIVRWYAGETARNRAILRTLDGLRSSLQGSPVVGVTGVTPLNPWFGNDGAFLLRRLKLANRWVVFADREYLERTQSLLGSLRMGSIEVRDVAQLSQADIPVLVLGLDGSGRLEPPRTSGPAVAKLHAGR